MAINVQLYRAGRGGLCFKAAVDLLDDKIDKQLSHDDHTFSTPGEALRDAASRIDNFLTITAFDEMGLGDVEDPPSPPPARTKRGAHT